MRRRPPISTRTDTLFPYTTLFRSGTRACDALPLRCLLSPVHIAPGDRRHRRRSEEHTSELQSLMRISYAVFCLKKKKHHDQRYSPLTTIPDRIRPTSAHSNTSRHTYTKRRTHSDINSLR